MELNTSIRLIRVCYTMSTSVMMMSGLAMMLAAFKAEYPFAIVGALLAVAALATYLLSFAALRRTRTVGVSRDGVSINGKLVVQRKRVQRAYFVPALKKTPAHVAVRGKGLHVEIGVTDEAQAKEVLSHLQMGIGEHASSFRGVSGWKTTSGKLVALSMALGLGIVFLGVAMVSTTSLFLPSLALGFLTLITGPAVFVPTTISIGTDGIVVKGTAHTELYNYGEITRVSPTGRGICIRVKDRNVNLRMAGNMALTRFELQDRAGMIERIKQAIARAKSGEATENDDRAARAGHRLDRAGRHLAEWIAELISDSTSDQADFRTAPIPTEDLYAVLDDRTKAPAARRVAAAMLLSKRGGEEACAKIRIAAEASAAPKFRVALETIASGELDTARLEAVVREAEEESATLTATARR